MEKETWLILDDCAYDRLHMERALSPNNDKIELIPAATIAETRDFLAQKNISVCLLDFYLKRNATTEELIAEIRKKWPRMPIIVVSSQTETSARLFNAGADCVIPKIQDTVSFGKSVISAVNHAKSQHTHQCANESSKHTYISEKARIAFSKAVKRDSGNILIVSPPGMGRTDIATALAERLQHRYKASHGDAIITISCKEYIDNPDTLDSIIFDTSAEKNTITTNGLLNRARTAILIIDDVHLMPKQVQEKIKTAFEKGYFYFGQNEKLRTSRLRVILTVQEREEHLLIQGLLQCLVSFRIRIPSFPGMLNELSELISFWFKLLARKKKKNTFKMTSKFKNCLADRIRKAPTRVTMRSVVKTIEAAIENAINEKRKHVTDADFGDFGFLFEDLPSGNMSADDSEVFTIPVDDPIGIAGWKEIYAAFNGSSLADTITLVRQFAIKYAMARSEGNCTKAAEKLGVVRQTLYKDNSRKLTFSEARKHGKGPKGVSYSSINDNNLDF